ncbi:MAG TPA: nitroreductase/quinone reductase family protein [Candidatus Dormibacteraeota bacterium]|nr:nitroreductase/quinone reductase family protein [Candidatus Dormibacteraeota bacterium]
MLPQGGLYAYRAASPARRFLRRLAGTAAASWVLARTGDHIDRLVFRASHGRQTLLGAVSGLPIVMLSTAGARSGLTSSVPLVAIPYGEGVGVVASNFGGHHHPAWYYNLLACPRAFISVDGVTTAVVARIASGEERKRLWELDTLNYPARRLYQRRAGNRDIPIFVLAPEPAVDVAAGPV